MTGQSDELRALLFVEVQQKMLNLAVAIDDVAHDRLSAAYDVHINQPHTGTTCAAGAGAMEERGEARRSAHEHVARRKEENSSSSQTRRECILFRPLLLQTTVLLLILPFQEHMDIEHAWIIT